MTLTVKLHHLSANGETLEDNVGKERDSGILNICMKSQDETHYFIQLVHAVNYKSSRNQIEM